MWDLLLNGLIVVVIAWGLYQVCHSDWVYEKYTRFTDYRIKHANVDKIAMVKLVSDDTKGIETFVNQNAEYLSKAMVQKLVNRIETLNYDTTIADDNVLKKRIANLGEPDELDGPVNFGKVMIEREKGRR
jgi:hypothetical protein